MIITAAFGSNLHIAKYHYCSDFSKYWYECHQAQRGFHIDKLTADGDWHAVLLQEIISLDGMEHQRGNWACSFAYFTRY